VTFDLLTETRLREICEGLATAQRTARDLRSSATPEVANRVLHDAVSTTLGALRAYCDAPMKREPARETARPSAIREIA
jgi:hypothetical protein